MVPITADMGGRARVEPRTGRLMIDAMPQAVIEPSIQESGIPIQVKSAPPVAPSSKARMKPGMRPVPLIPPACRSDGMPKRAPGQSRAFWELLFCIAHVCEGSGDESGTLSED